jgi:hypothetical protein
MLQNDLYEYIAAIWGKFILPLPVLSMLIITLDVFRILVQLGIFPGKF